MEPTMKKLKVVGNGEAFTSSLCNTSFRLDLGGSAILIDCGYQVPPKLWAEEDHTDIDLILLTHFHADHSFGVVPLLVRYLEEKRTKPLNIWGPKGVESFVTKILNLGYPGVSKFFKYQIEFSEFEEIDEKHFGEIQIRSAPTVHSIPNLTYRLDFNGSSFSVSGDGKLKPEAMAMVSGVGIHFQETYELLDEIPSHCSFEEVLQMHNAGTMQSIGITHIARHAVEPLTTLHKKLTMENKIDGNLFLTHPGQSFEF